jgi:hypothetical protein
MRVRLVRGMFFGVLWRGRADVRPRGTCGTWYERASDPQVTCPSTNNVAAQTWYEWLLLAVSGHLISLILGQSNDRFGEKQTFVFAPGRESPCGVFLFSLWRGAAPYAHLRPFEIGTPIRVFPQKAQ